MNDNHRISKTEWKIMDIIWSKPGLTPKEIVSELVNENWSYTTITTMLSRLIKKNAVEVRKQGNLNLYYAAMPRENCVQQETRNFIDKVFKGSFKNLVASFMEDVDLTDKEIEEIRAILNKASDQSNRRKEK